MNVYFNLVNGFALGFIVYQTSMEYDVAPEEDVTEIDIIFGFVSIKIICYPK